MKETLFALLVWINQHSAFEYDLAGGVPDLKQVGADELVMVAFQGNVPSHLAGPGLEEIKQALTAVYNQDERAIYIKSEVDLGSDYGKSVLVHELVHFVQYETGVNARVKCGSALEYDAYHIQKAFLVESGLKPDYDDFTVAIRSMCW
jgi:hypothetical protein